MQRLGLLVLALILSSFGSPGAEAALKKYNLYVVALTQSPETSPKILFTLPGVPPEPPINRTFVDDSDPGSPVLKKLRIFASGTGTVDVPALSATIFISSDFIEGPGPPLKPNTFTGSGATAPGSTIRWGIVTGWTITGSQFCNSVPPVICTLAMLNDDTTSEPLWNSDFYDLGTWRFHSTGFTGTPFVHQYFTNPGNFGNSMRWLRGFSVVDATVPALPAVGVALLGGSLVVGALIAIGRGREK